MNKNIIVSLIITTSTLFASVEHKDEFIDLYLSNISSNMDEKTEIIEHIKQNLNGIYIDIGTGGDAIAFLASELPSNSRPTLIAADIDPLVISSIKQRRPEIEKYLNSKEGPKVNLVTMSAVDMNPIKDSSIAGVGASALTHEIFSYVPSKSSLDQFTDEVCRVLEKEGVFVYRDPKWVDDPQTPVTLVIKNETFKYYVSLFLPKFLDKTFSKHIDYKSECCKPDIYPEEEITFNVFLKNKGSFKKISYKEFLSTPSALIDYEKSFSIEAPKGLVAEIQRHYLMFLKDYFAIGLIDPSLYQDGLELNILTQDEKDAVLAFIAKKGVSLEENRITKETYPILFSEYNLFKRYFLNGFTVDITHNPELFNYIQQLSNEGIDRNLIYLQDAGTLMIDAKMLPLLFQGKGKGLYRFLPDDLNLFYDILEHLKMEGEEHYFYKTTDELITYFGQYSNFILKDTHKAGYILAPCGLDYIKERSRLLYKRVLTRDSSVMDLHGNIQQPTTEKNIIHFKLMPKEEAINIYRAITLSDPARYVTLKAWLDKDCK